MSSDNVIANFSSSGPPSHSTNVHVSTPQTGIMPIYQGAEGAQIQTNFRMDLNQDSLAAIAVTEAETQIRQRLSTLNKEHAALTRDLRALENYRTDYLHDWTRVQNKDDKNFDALIAALRPYTGRSLNPSYAPAVYNTRTGTLSGLITVSAADVLSFSHTYEAPPAPEFLKSLEDTKALTAKIGLLNADILGTRSALNNVDALERQAKARLASEIATRSGATGAALVESIKAGVNLADIVDQFRQ